MPAAIPLIIAAIGAGGSIAGGYLANRSSGQQTGSSMPTVAPGYGPLQSQILDMVRSRLSAPIDTTGYRASGVANINRAADLEKTNLDNTLTARGLYGSPVAAAGATTLEGQRIGHVASFENSIPMLVEQMRSQRLGEANAVLSGGRGITSTGSQTAEGGGGAAGAFTNLAAYLGYLNATGAFNNLGRQPIAARQTVPNVGFMPAGGPY